MVTIFHHWRSHPVGVTLMHGRSPTSRERRSSLRLWRCWNGRPRLPEAKLCPLLLNATPQEQVPVISGVPAKESRTDSAHEKFDFNDTCALTYLRQVLSSEG